MEIVNNDLSGSNPELVITDETKDIDTVKLFQPQRLEGESFEEYKERRLVANYKLHLMSKGKLIWNSRPLVNQKGISFRKQK